MQIDYAITIRGKLLADSDVVEPDRGICVYIREDARRAFLRVNSAAGEIE
jgi:hypothetical protein